MNTYKQDNCYTGNSADSILILGIAGLLLLFIFLVYMVLNNTRTLHHSAGSAIMNFRSDGFKSITSAEVEFEYAVPGTGKVSLNIHLE